MSALDRLATDIARLRDDPGFTRVHGVVTTMAPGHLAVAGLSPFVSLGDRVMVEGRDGPALGEVIRVEGGSALVKAYEARLAAGIGARAHPCGPQWLYPCEEWKGRAISALGEPIDNAGPLPAGPRRLALEASPPSPLLRARVRNPVKTGVKAIDLFTPICAGQRIGIFAGSGVGKSTLLAMLAGSEAFDTTVIALVGERGREVREFLEDALQHRGASAITIVATGDESPMTRRLAPITAMRIAEHFRDEGQSVLLIVDSVTRYAHALREVALAAGEPPVARGYTPSVFSDLPKLLERAGPGEEGSGTITGIFSVLVDGDDHNDPVADSIRGTLDGHLVLDRAIADQGRYPAIDILSSVSRLAQFAWSADEQSLVRKLKAMIARYEDTRDLRLLGGYQAGSDPSLDQALTLVPKIYEAISQSPRDLLSRDAFQDLSRALQAG